MKKQNRLLVFLKDKRKKPFFQMAKEFLHLLILKREIPFYYFKEQYRKEVTDYKAYISTGETKRIKNSSNFKKPEFLALDQNKLFFALFCKTHQLPTPVLGGFNYTQTFYLKEKVFIVKNFEDLKDYFNALFEDTGWNSVFLKPMQGERGAGCFKVYKDSIESISDELYTTLVFNSYIYQQVIEQHETLNRINPNCVNSIRIESFKDKWGVSHALNAYLKIGGETAIIDNSSSGGFWVQIDIESGRLKGLGYGNMEYGGEEFQFHPVSGIKFDGYEIPFFKEMMALFESAGAYFPHRILGWDIAIAKSGPTLIEINANPELSYKHPMYTEILKEA